MHDIGRAIALSYQSFAKGVMGSKLGAILRLGVTLVLIVVIALWLRPHALSSYHLEAGGCALEEALEPVFSDRLAPEQIVDGEQLQTGVTHLLEALRWDPRNVQALRILARVYLSQGQPQAALEVMQQALDLGPADPLLHLELGDVYDSLGRTEEARQSYEAGGVGSRGVPLAANYLKLAEAQMLWGSGELAIEFWRKTVEVDPGNLYALYQLMEIHRDLGSEEHAIAYEEQLRYFDLQSVTVPPDFRLAEYQGWTMAMLVDSGTWDRDTLLNVISYQVWQFSEGLYGLMTEQVLQTLLQHWPEDPVLLFYLAEIHHQRGDLEGLEAVYEQVLAVEPQYAQVYLRLGMLAEASYELRGASVAKLAEAAEWYGQYYDTTPDDLLGLWRLVGVCTTLEDSGVENGDCGEMAERVTEEHSSNEDDEQAESHSSPLPDRGSSAEVLRDEWLMRVASVEPAYLVGETLDTGWTLLGYDVDEDHLFRGEPADLLLYWEGPASASAGSEQEGWHQAGERWVQVLEGLQNLILNGGFELGMEDGSPAGFPGDIYYADSGTRQMITESRGEHHTVVALLDSTRIHSGTSFVSNKVPVYLGSLYLQAGWMRTVEGNGYLGRRWVGDIAEGQVYSYIVEGATVNNWEHYTGLTRPPAGATHCQIWLINYPAVGQVFFDNILFAEIGQPGE
jgi:tetratricopeptide (TPR) repeat protein